MQPAPQLSVTIRFGVFEADLRSGELRKNGLKVKLQDLPFRALRLFLSRPNEVLSRDEFRQALWPENVFVDFDHGISSAINRLRDALGDSADNPVFIETVERRGYRWIAPTHFPAPPEPPRLEIVKPVEKSLERAPAQPVRWNRVIIFPVAALVLIAWSFWPMYRAAKAGGRKAPSTTNRSSNSAHNPALADAEQFYLKGRFYWEKRTPEGLTEAVDYFTQAIVHDPDYAPAYVGLADTYNLMREFTLMPSSEAYPRALAAATKAVELDDQSSDAHASLGFVLFWGMWDSAGAEREFRRALELNPNNAVAHHWYATYLGAVGRHADSISEIDRAQALDPASKAILADKGTLLWWAGRHDESLTLLKQMVAAEPNFVSPHRYLKSSYFDSGDYKHFLEEWKKEATLMHDSQGLKMAENAEAGFAQGGARGMLQNMRTMKKKLYDRGEQSAYSLAEIEALLGNEQEALSYLKIAYDRHDEAEVQMMGNPAFNSLHEDPAYKDLIARLAAAPKN
jgi:DNA-binding winged helix-turn-helix (wHTH) protein/Tfp pilus assembly protein PilF